MTTTKIASVVKSHTSPDTVPNEEPDTADEEADNAEHDKLRKTFDNISTADLIAELNRRGFIVYNKDGKEMKTNA